MIPALKSECDLITYSTIMKNNNDIMFQIVIYLNKVYDIIGVKINSLPGIGRKEFHHGS